MPRRMSAASSSRRSKTCARSPSSCGRRRSTTSVSCRRSSASARRSRERSGIETVVQANLEERLSPEVETTLYRVVQEALTNVVKHAGAEHVSIVISNREGQRRCDDRRRRPGLRQRRCARRMRSACSVCESGSRSSAGRSKSSPRPDPGRRSPLRCRRRRGPDGGAPAALCREQRGDLVQRARATKARDPHDVLADEANLDRR